MKMAGYAGGNWRQHLFTQSQGCHQAPRSRDNARKHAREEMTWRRKQPHVHLKTGREWKRKIKYRKGEDGLRKMAEYTEIVWLSKGTPAVSAGLAPTPPPSDKCASFLSEAVTLG